jgi:hypothetical protein
VSKASPVAESKASPVAESKASPALLYGTQYNYPGPYATSYATAAYAPYGTAAYAPYGTAASIYRPTHGLNNIRPYNYFHNNNYNGLGYYANNSPNYFPNNRIYGNGLYSTGARLTNLRTLNILRNP